MKIITKTILVLSLVSMFTDMASEMLYPVIPVYLKVIGFSVPLIGILEGISELTAGLSKGYFGKKSDEKGRRLPFVQLGYFLSAVSKPMMAMLTYPLWIFFSRTTDRLGKGLRTAPRDALLSASATRETKARVFGFHRGMDTMGAVLGPALALAFLSLYPNDYTLLFYLAFIPGIIAVLLLFLLKEEKTPPRKTDSRHFFSYFGYWRSAGGGFRKIVPGLLFFALFNSSDVFLILRTREITGENNTYLVAYIFYNLVYALGAYPLGSLADKWGMKNVFISGMVLFTLVYTGFCFAGSTVELFVLFFLYGIYAAATEGVAKAWITNNTAASSTATAVGFYTSLQSICSLLASTVAGLLWFAYGSVLTFGVTAAAAFLVFLYFLLIKRNLQ